MRLSLLTALLLPLAVAAAPQPLDRIVVVVNDGVVLQSELDRAVQAGRRQIEERGIVAPSESALRGQVLERLILTRLQTQRAQEAGIRVDDRELNEVLAGIAARNNMSLGEFAEAVRKEGMDYLALREQIRDEVVVSRLRAREVDSRVLVTDQDIQLFLGSRAAEDSAEYRLTHILVALPEGANDQARAEARAKAEGLRKRIAEGEDFAQVAIAHSDGQQALQGGDLDWRKRADLPELFAGEVARMKPGDVSAVLETGSGFHLIRLADQRNGGERQTSTETHAQHILIQANALRTPEQAQKLAAELHEKLKNGADFAELAKQHSDDPGSKNAGGDLGWQPVGVFVPEFQQALDGLPDGGLSEPFKTEFGWHIARTIERRTRDVTDETKRARARQAIQNRKSAEEYDLWLRRLRAEAYVEYRLQTAEGGAKAAADDPS
ncbi:MAG: peptidylprolyl isomerase [Gammaproteobacteria bacterium]|nr:peptidylprolyl isomerase [Gammaproteobacteria bacterium]